ncbi:hypothetical protein HDU76_007140, partial [Blyttiomyces sp. JEL0837]
FLALRDIDNVDIDVISRFVLTSAAANGHLELMKDLVQLPGVDPTAAENASLIKVSLHGHLAVVQFLLTLPGVDATAQNNKAIRKAASGGHLIVPSSEGFLDSFFEAVFSLEGLRVVLRYSGVNAVAITTKYPQKPLVEFPGVDVTFDDYAAVRIAAEHGNLETVDYLMGLPDIDKAAMGNSAVAGAASDGDLELVKLLLEVPEVAASADKSMAIKMAAEKGRIEILKLLLKVPAGVNGHVDALQLLLDNVLDSNVVVDMVKQYGAEGYVGLHSGL